jgi:hypothetical protein
MYITIALAFAFIATCILLFIQIRKAKELKIESDKLKMESDKLKMESDKLKMESDKLKSNLDIYKNIIDVESHLSLKNNELLCLKKDYTDKKMLYDELLSEITSMEENLENISYGVYKPHYDFQTSHQYKNELENLQTKEKALIKSGAATYCGIPWTVEGSKSKGNQMLKHQSKLMLRAFNGECDAAISKVNWNNIKIMETRVRKAFDAINKLGETQQNSIVGEYLNLKMMELQLEYELKEKLYQEKEEQRKIREQMREDEKVLAEIEKATSDAEKDEKIYQKALEKARKELSITTGVELIQLNDKIKQLEENLLLAQQARQRAISMAQQTKSGHVYIISNIGSFGDDIFKIGMTRRLEPQDRIDELGNASVPFNFDVHGVIYTENAPELENNIHKILSEKKINLVNKRREFFNVTIDDIEKVVRDLNCHVELTKLAEAKEYKLSKQMRMNNSAKPVVQKFPELI